MFLLKAIQPKRRQNSQEEEDTERKEVNQVSSDTSLDTVYSMIVYFDGRRLSREKRRATFKVKQVNKIEEDKKLENLRTEKIVQVPCLLTDDSEYSFMLTIRIHALLRCLRTPESGEHHHAPVVQSVLFFQACFDAILRHDNVCLDFVLKNRKELLIVMGFLRRCFMLPKLSWTMQDESFNDFAFEYVLTDSIRVPK